MVTVANKSSSFADLSRIPNAREKSQRPTYVAL
jgi:hypothetical protein